MSAPLFSLDAVDAGYERAQVLFGVSMAVAEGEVVALMGRNGMGKTTTINTLFGLIPCRAGRRLIDGRDMTDASPHAIARRGLGLVPEGRQIFPRLDVRENLIATARSGAGPWTLARVYALFPRLQERAANMGNQLSGGEQQMLAIGRALMTNPRLLVLDEATEGLAPLIRAEIWAAITHLKAEGLAILIIDKNLDALLNICDRHVVMERGHIRWQGATAALRADRRLAEDHLEIAAAPPSQERG
ncbi:MAG: ABC transporter ATP-binding protein [Hyphomicrobiales bacterium]|nr:ABC transporter ATP-binding protein [Hyphomicrobiales bacterium]